MNISGYSTGSSTWSYYVFAGCVVVATAFCCPVLANPLANDTDTDATFKRYRNPAIAIMNNSDLFEKAQQSGSSPSSSVQSQLNRQWLESHAHDDVLQGGKALSKLLQRGFKGYWDTQKQERFSNSEKIPDIYGRGQVSNSLEYDVKLKSDELRIGLSYEF